MQVMTEDVRFGYGERRLAGKVDMQKERVCSRKAKDGKPRKVGRGKTRAEYARHIHVGWFR